MLRARVLQNGLMSIHFCDGQRQNGRRQTESRSSKTASGNSLTSRDGVRRICSLCTFIPKRTGPRVPRSHEPPGRRSSRVSADLSAAVLKAVFTCVNLMNVTQIAFKDGSSVRPLTSSGVVRHTSSFRSSVRRIDVVRVPIFKSSFTFKLSPDNNEMRA